MKHAVIEKYGVTLRRLTEDKIEMVRCWRNDPKIQQYMFYKEYITPEMQKKWFERINNENNYYYIIELEGKEIGLANIKDINWEKKEGEAGIFIYDDNYLDGVFSYQISLAMSYVEFTLLGLNRITAVVRKDNKRALDYNLSLGAKVIPNESPESDVVRIFFEKNNGVENKKLKRLINYFNKL